MIRHLLTMLLAAVLMAIPMAAVAKEPPAPKGKLVFVAMTGPEDAVTLASSFRHALAAKKSGYLEDVVWLSWGRAVVALDSEASVLPAEVKESAKAAQKGGVRLVACGQALRKWNVDESKLEPKADVVANGVNELARLVSLGYEVIRY